MESTFGEHGGIRGRFYAIEVKNNRSIRPEDLRGLRTFLQDYLEAFALFLYRGEETLERGGILCMPIEAFLTKLIPRKELPR